MNICNSRIQKFIVRGRADSNYTTNKEIHKSVSSLEVTLNSILVVMRSVGQKIIILSVTEAELIALVQVVQEMLYIIRILESL